MERACRKTDLGGDDYYLRKSGLPPSSKSTNVSCMNLHVLGNRTLGQRVLDVGSLGPIGKRTLGHRESNIWT